MKSDARFLAELRIEVEPNARKFVCSFLIKITQQITNNLVTTLELSGQTHNISIFLNNKQAAESIMKGTSGTSRQEGIKDKS